MTFWEEVLAIVIGIVSASWVEAIIAGILRYMMNQRPSQKPDPRP